MVIRNKSKASNESSAETAPQSSGSKGFDGEYRKPKRRFDLAVFLGDVAGAIMGFIINPNSLYFITLGLAGVVLCLNSVPYIALFNGELRQLARGAESIPYIGFILSFSRQTIATVLGVSLLLVVQTLEVIPVAPRLITAWGERLYFKSNRKRFETPYKGENAPSIIPKAYNWVRKSVEKQHELGLLISIGFYLFDLWICAKTYPIWDSVGGLIFGNLLFVGILVGGFTGLLLVAAIFNSHRLTGFEHNEFHAMKDELEPPKYTGKE